MIHPQQLRELVIRRTLKEIKLWSPAAEDLLLATAIAESVIGPYQYLKQRGAGPAVSIYQIEPVTARDMMGRFLKKRRHHDLRERVMQLRTPGRALPMDLIARLDLATAVARLKYYSSPKPLPLAGDLAAIARYWKEIYNTAGGKGRVGAFVRKVKPYF